MANGFQCRCRRLKVTELRADPRERCILPANPKKE
jgi:hypothetical protein